MIVIDRKLFGIVPYTTVFFPAEGASESIISSVGAGHLVRMFWSLTPLKLRDCVIRYKVTATVCLDLRKSCEDLWRGLTKNARNEIRSVERLADRVRVERNSPDSLKQFLGIYNLFAEKKTGVAQTRESVIQRYAEHSDVFVAYLDGQAMCGHVYLRDATLGRARMLYSASRRLEDQTTARLCGQMNRFLHWHEVSCYREGGLVTYDLGGIREDKTDGIARFKTSFGGEVSREFTYLCAGSRSIAAIGRVIDGVRRGRPRETPESKREAASFAPASEGTPGEG